jgi:hypothetical protein
MRQEAITKVIVYRWAVLLLVGLFMVSGAFAQQVLYSYTTTNPGVFPVVATTAPPAGSYRGQYVVSMSQASTGGAVELRAFLETVQLSLPESHLESATCQLLCTCEQLDSR